jgi:Replication-relaxation
MAVTRRGMTLTGGTILGLFFVQRYRFLTIEQFARAAGMKRAAASDQLRALERHGLLGHFGNVGMRGFGKTPKVYYLKRKGFEILTRESDIPAELIGTHKETHVEARWSPQMYHRLHTIDLMVAAEVAVRGRPNLSMVRTFIEYRRVKRAGRLFRETADLVAPEDTPDNRIIPDAAFVLENVETGRRALFFVEMDMATERVVSLITRDRRITLHHRITQYDRYLMSGRFARTYAAFGEFRFFTLLFVTFGEGRIDNIRRALADLPRGLHPYYRFTTFEQAKADFFAGHWRSRSPDDQEGHMIVR